MTEQNEEKNLPEVATPKHPAAIGASLFLDVNRFEFAQRVATMLSKSTMVPEHFRNNVGNCMIALNLAERFMADPFMVMQTVYVVHGKPGLEGKLVIALLNQCGKFSPLQYKFTRDSSGKATACTAYATHLETKEKLEQTVTWEMVHAEGWDAKKGSKWLTMPELMFQYRSATFFARVYCPEVILGMQTTDEIFDFTNMTNQGGTFKVQNAGTSDLSDKIKKAQKAEPEPSTKIDEPKPSEPEKPKTIEEPFFEGQEPELQKTEEIKTESSGNIKEALEGNFRDAWINMRSAGFSTFVHKNRSGFESASPELQEEARVKWEKFYPGIFWPIESKPKDDERLKMIDAIKGFFEPEAIERALSYQHQTNLNDCTIETLDMIYGYLQKSEKEDDLM